MFVPSNSLPCCEYYRFRNCSPRFDSASVRDVKIISSKFPIYVFTRRLTRCILCGSSKQESTSATTRTSGRLRTNPGFVTSHNASVPASRQVAARYEFASNAGDRVCFYYITMRAVKLERERRRRPVLYKLIDHTSNIMLTKKQGRRSEKASIIYNPCLPCTRITRSSGRPIDPAQPLLLPLLLCVAVGLACCPRSRKSHPTVGVAPENP